MVDGQGPILIVGAGPVGLTLAIDLARRGVPIRIIDKLPAPTTESRAIVIHARTLDQLELIGVNEPLLAAGLQSTGVELHAGRKRLAYIPFDGVASRHPYSLTIAQPETERVLAERLAQLGVSVERGVTFVGLEQHADEVRATLERTDGTRQTIAPSWVVGTDGARGQVRGETGQKLDGVFEGENFLLADLDAEHAYDPRSFHIFFSPGDATGLVFPMAGGRVRVFAQIPAGVEETPALGWLREVLEQRHMQLTIHAVHWLARFEIHHAQVASYRTGRVFLAGDAAHVQSPAGGQGMNTGMQDALNLSWKLALVWHGRSNEGLLDSYHDERHPIAAHMLAFTTRLTRVGTLTSSVLTNLRNAAMQMMLRFRAPQHALANELEEQTVSYRGSAIVGPAVACGEFWRDGQDSRVTAALQNGDTARGLGHVAVIVESTDGAPPRIALPVGIPRVTLAPDAKLAARLGLARSAGVVLVRPDGYIGAIAKPDDTAIAQYVARLGLRTPASPSAPTTGR
jgi:2-polyprenyl-6-methoxyphenol hydroxylase-like FAD-dependent oxidoreductase